MSATVDAARWRMLGWICLAELGALSLWFSATAVVPALAVPWMSTAARAWLSTAVTLGFVVGTALGSALMVADVVGARRLFAASAVGGAAVNAALLLTIDSLPAVVACRFLTGLAMAGVYPPGMKLAASWFRRDRGLAVGSLVGAVTFGSAIPHLFNVLGGLAWRPVIAWTSLSALAAAAVVLALVRDGPHVQGRAPFDPRALGELARSRGVRLANAGYFGHMWELYAMWTWIGLYLAEAFAGAGVADPYRASALASFAVIAAGGAGSVLAGLLADRIGRTATTMLIMAGSGTCAALIGLTFGRPWLLVAVALVWGLTIVADSAQFSAAVSELAPPQYVATALSLQTSLGFLLTFGSIHLVPVAAEAIGLAWSFAVLVPGPLLGAIAMWRLRRLPESRRLAQGRR